MNVRGTILNPQADGTVKLYTDGLITADESGTIVSIGSCPEDCEISREVGVIVPAMFDNHIHIPQHPIRGRFAEGIGSDPPGGRLLASLNQNVFPAESRCAKDDYTRAIVAEFAQDTLAHGVIGGAAYMTVHPSAARIALGALPKSWHVGPVLMNQNCPEYLRTDPETWRDAYVSLANEFGKRVIVTDRFAVAVDSELRRDAAKLAKRLGLRMQTHLNEQRSEKAFVEKTLYPSMRDYTSVYEADGLLECDAILAHCIWMSESEWAKVANTHAAVAHCPTSNALLGSGVMPLDELLRFDIDYAICTDVGASPTTSLLCEMAVFLLTHAGRSKRATASEALYRTTLAAAKMLRVDQKYGSLEPGKSLSFVELNLARAISSVPDAEDVIRAVLGIDQPSAEWIAARDALADGGLEAGPMLTILDDEIRRINRSLDDAVRKVVVDGEIVFARQN